MNEDSLENHDTSTLLHVTTLESADSETDASPSETEAEVSFQGNSFGGNVCLGSSEHFSGGVFLMDT